MSDLRLELERTSFFPGEEVRGLVRWDLGSPPSRGELRLRWDTAGSGDPESEVVGVVPLRELTRPPDPNASASPYRTIQLSDDVPAPLEARDCRVFRFRLPERPVSFSGRLITLTWSIEVVTGSGDCRVVIVLSPTGAEVRL